MPLFVEELTAALLTSGALDVQEHHYELKDWNPARQLPISLRDLLQSRLDQLAPADRTVVQVCAVIGGDATARIVSSVLGEPDSRPAREALERLADAGFLQHTAGNGSYAIRHALIENAAYESLLKTARTRYHVRVAELLKAGGFEGMQAAPELVAQHFTLAGLLDAAVPLWLESAQLALRRSALNEAIALARRGIEVLERAGNPTALRRGQVMLATTLGMALVASKGFANPDAAAAFQQAEALLAGVDDPATRFPVMWGLCMTHFMRGQLDLARGYSTQMLAIGRATGAGNLLIEALWMHGVVHFWLGEVDQAEEHLTEAIRIYEPAHHLNAHLFGQDPCVAALVYLTQVHAHRLRPREASECAQRALDLAHQLRHPHTVVWAISGATMVKLHFADFAGTLASAPEAIAYCMKQEHPFWLSALQMMMGSASAHLGRAEEGLKMAREGFALYEMLGTSLIAPFFCALLADCCTLAGEIVEAATWVARARAMVVKNNEQLSRPAVLMVAGRLLERQGQPAPAESCYREARECAHAHGTLMNEVQAAALLAQLLATQGRMPEAGAVLMPYAPVVMSPDAPEFLRPLGEFMAAAAAGQN